MRARGKERTRERLMCGNRFNNVRRWNTKTVRSVCSRAITILCQMSVCIRNAMCSLRPKKYEDKKKVRVAFRCIYLRTKTQQSRTRRRKLSWFRLSLSVRLALSCTSSSFCPPFQNLCVHAHRLKYIYIYMYLYWVMCIHTHRFWNIFLNFYIYIFVYIFLDIF